MADNKVVLYDLPSKGRSACWSLNPWKTRLVLNFKNIPYETQWVEYPDIEPLFKSFGIPPQTGEIAAYTIPAIRTPQGNYIMNSLPIAQALEALQPEPSLRVDDPAVSRVQALVQETLMALAAVLLAPVPRDLLREASVPYFEETRKNLFGMSLAELEEAKGGDPAWEAARPLFAKAGAALREVPGPFFLGEKVSYADFVYVGLVEFIRRTKGIEYYNRVVGWEKEIGALYDACAKWVERDDL
ncbi:hypothetical protein SODALDRAFT_343061 [Sodiomyces alkalinus F11]|uniref:Uncharacterized protein n=1 Tax=Sodiomyces alkalinus (strain CBS 110278 / VKM F-3762 / F11) TaxID=1314773 RepID=A0A3N2Q1Z2_SODAK|nr:hypothetical protein SODALDRAFT_343061 [Sodiomyces alkalinus F11]ROT40781.1 hypothetical protein SODALDRAFT_343061 [Sodiomyces alkalinus F11]